MHVTSPGECSRVRIEVVERPRLATLTSAEVERPVMEEESVLGSHGRSGDNTDLAWASSSRLDSEFQILRWLGQGGFGDVVQVRNRLDGNYYAIKRIPLHARSRLLRRKITREVKLLSRLNHENVVRYYNSWMETVAVESEAEATETSESQAPDPVETLNPEAPLPSTAWAHSKEWSVSYGVGPESASSSEESESDEEPFFGPSKAQSPVVSVDFQHQEGEENGEIHWETTTDHSSTSPSTRQILYIQMEFCEKETLRESIDRCETFGNPRRAWRLFREILEGLAYIHYQVKMIHRDIKPVNIFLDALDHAKIGDFGLACASDRKGISGVEGGMGSWRDDSDLTTEVGTALYVAPELAQTTKAHYNQKVDVFSLGIVLFEMFYYPLKAGMERVSTLRALRSTKIAIPEDFASELPSKQKERLDKLIRWMLEPESRASTEEVLRSPLLPPVEMAEVEFQDAFHLALAHTQTRNYKWLMASLFAPDRFPSSAHDYCFDQDVDSLRTEFEPRRARLWASLRWRLVRLLRRHGAVQVSAPALLPKNRLLRSVAANSAAELMDPSGMLVALPWDLRLGFARWVVRQKIGRMKRFDIGSVFRPSPLPNSHPREVTECALDIIGGALSGSVATAEILSTLGEIVDELGWTAHGGGRLRLRLNHGRLLRALLAIAGVREQEAAVLSALEMGKGVSKDVQKRLSQIPNLSERSIAHALGFIALNGRTETVFSQLRSLTHNYRKTDSGLVEAGGGIAAILKETRLEIERVEKASQCLGLTLGMTVDLGLVVRPAEYDSGLVFQLSYQLPEGKRGKAAREEGVLAAGGRYDSLLERMRKPAMEMSPPTPLVAVGLSLSLAPFLALALRHSLAEAGMRERSREDVEVLVCSSGRENAVLMEKLRIVRALWNAGIPADFLHDPLLSNLESLEEHCKESGISFLLLVKGAGGNTAHLLKHWVESESRFQDHKVFGAELVPTILSQRADGEAEEGHIPVAKQVSAVFVPEDRPGPTSANPGNIKVTFLVGSGKGKLSGHNRKNYEQNVAAVLSGLLSKLSPRVVVEVLATDLRKEAVITIASALQLRGSLVAFRESFQRVQASLPNALKESLRLVEEAVGDVAYRAEEPTLDASNVLLVLYAYHDDAYRILT